MLNKKRRALLPALLLSVAFSGSAVDMWEKFSPEALGYYERGLDMASEGNYAGAVDQLSFISADAALLSPEERNEVAYTLALALYERDDARCVALLRDFAEENPASPLALRARLAEADYYFFQHRFGQALTLYDRIDFRRLDRSQEPVYTYRRGLCMVKTGHGKESAPLFRSLLDSREYGKAARFYLAYLKYAEGDYDTAYREFEAVADELPASSAEDNAYVRPARRGRQSSMPAAKEYKPTGLEAAYYMTQIEYDRGEYGDVISHGRALLEKKPVEMLVPEMQRIMGLSYFKTGKYPAAKSYLHGYVDAVGEENATPDALYTLGVIAYSEGDYATAARFLSPLCDLENEFGQSASLYIGQCAVADGNPTAAAMAFEKAARMDFDPSVTEAAMYNYVASYTRGGNIPFTSSVDMLESFLLRFPRSSYAPAVEEYLATAYFNEKDYAKALKSINGIPNPSSRILEAKQKVLYELGVQEMNNGQAQEAVAHLSQAVALERYGRDIARDARLWLADALYSCGEYGKSASAYTQYLSYATRDSNRTLAIYNLAYALYMQDSFSQAATRFREALDARPALPAPLLEDAGVRLADCLYYSGSYRKAISAYGDAMAKGGAAADYAAWRRAVLYGLDGDVDRKLKELNSFRKTYPESKWLPDVLLEKGMTLAGLNRVQAAAEAFSELASRFPRAPQNRQATLNLALAYMLDNQTGKAEEAYRSVIRQWPSSQEAATANEDLRRHYAAKGELKEYSEFLAGVEGAPQLHADEMEKLSFDAAENAFSEDIADTARLEKYIRDYPNGRYLANALMDIAESQKEKEDWEGALRSLDILLEKRPDSQYVPDALMMKGELLETRMQGRGDDALAVWRELEARGGADYAPEAYAGVMRTTSDPRERVEYARKVKKTGGISAELMEEASLYEALGMRKGGKRGEALEILRSLSANPRSVAGAHAAVVLGEELLSSGDPAGAEKVLSDFTGSDTPQQYWLARGFIALADVYAAEGKKYLAVEYVKSLRDNYPGNELDIHDMIASRLKKWK